ncbi:MAG: TIGR02757 family protein [Deltaproteobacteria bacterium]|nr:TIGR02757 family protein [Deltaproteobacteria bacterium]
MGIHRRNAEKPSRKRGPGKSSLTGGKTTSRKPSSDSNLPVFLEELYARYNSRAFVHPDPLEFLYRYKNVEDREIVGLVASCLAYGRVSQILTSVAGLLDLLGDSPASFIDGTSRQELGRRLGGFRHRFTTGRQIAALLWGVKKTRDDFGSLEGCFAEHLDSGHAKMLHAQEGFCEHIRRRSAEDLKFLLPSPRDKSACKRLNLYLRWMVREDDVDPGGWTKVPASKLLIPLDTHMFAVGTALGFTRRRTADLKSVLEVTSGFERIVPKDPARYDFALTRHGIWGDGPSFYATLKNEFSNDAEVAST